MFLLDSNQVFSFINHKYSDDTIYVGNYNRDNDYDGLTQKAISTCPNINKGYSKKHTP